MTTIELARLVKQMRDSQKAYFKARREGKQAQNEIEESKAAEKRVDMAVKRVIDEPEFLPGFKQSSV